MKYFLHISGESDGCDYTIACNEVLITIDADNLNDAKQEALKEVESYQNPEETYHYRLIVASDIFILDSGDPWKKT